MIINCIFDYNKIIHNKLQILLLLQKLYHFKMSKMHNYPMLDPINFLMLFYNLIL